VCRFLRRRVDGLEVGVWRVCGVVGRFVSGRGRERGSGGEFFFFSVCGDFYETDWLLS